MSGGGHRGHTAGPGSGGGGGASGCPAIQQNGARCGETKTLDIIREFRELYETKMKIIDSEAGGDCNVQAKLNLQTDWIHDLTEQNEMLVRAVEELEQEATQRVLALEDKLKETSKCCCENEDKENKIRELEEKLRMTCEEVAMAKKVNENYAALKQMEKELRGRLCDMERENEELRCAVQGAKDELEILADKAEQYMIEICELRNCNSDQTDRFHILHSEKVKIENECCSMKQQMESMECKLREQMDKVAIFESSNNESESCNAHLRKEVACLSRDYQKAQDKIQALQMQIKETNMLLNNRCEELNEQSARLDCRAKECQMLGLSKVQADQRCKQLQENVEKLLHYQNSFDESREVIVHLQHELNVAEDERRRAEDEVCALNCQFKDQCNLVRELQNSLKRPLVKSIGIDPCQIPTCDREQNTIRCECTDASTGPEMVHYRENIAGRELHFRDATTEALLDSCNEYTSASDSSSYCDVKVMKPAPTKSFNSTSGPASFSVDYKMSSLQGETQQLQGAVCELTTSVTRMIVREDEVKQAQLRIADLEKQIQSACRQKDNEVEKARTCREREVCNLKETIGTLVKSLENERKRSENLQNVMFQRQLLIQKLWHIIEYANNQSEAYKEQINQFLRTVEDLRDENTELETDLFYNAQDMEIYEMRVLQYQNLFKSLKEECVELQQKIHDMELEREDQNYFTEQIGCQLKSCKEELKWLEDLIRQEQSITEDETYNMSQQIQQLQDELARVTQEMVELKISVEEERTNHSKTQGALASKECEASCLCSEVEALKEKLSLAAQQLIKCKEIEAVLRHSLEQYEESNTILDEQSGRCHKQASQCIEALHDLRLELKKRTEESHELKQQLSDQQNTIKSVKSELKKAKSCSPEELAKREQMICTMQEKLAQKIEEIDRLNNDLHTLDMRLAEENRKKASLSSMQEELEESIQRKLREHQVETEAYETTIESLQQRLELMRQNYLQSEESLEETIHDLQEKVVTMESRFRCVDEQLRSTRQKLQENEQDELKIIEDYEEKEKNYTSKIQVFQREKESYINTIKDMEERTAILQCELMHKDKQLDEVKKSFVELQKISRNSEEIKSEELCSLKNEINNLVQTQNSLKSENEVLQLQVCKLRTIIGKNEEKKKLMSSELEHCLTQIQGIQQDKDFLIEKNESLTREIRSLQDTCQSKTESMVTLEMELNDTRCLRDTLCNESRNVINNVKSWLGEQRRINVELDAKIREKNSIISNLKLEKMSLQNKLKQYPMSSKNASTYVQSTSSRSRSKGLDTCPQSSRQLWSINSVESANYSGSSDAEWETEHNDDSAPDIWVHRVESLTEELQKNNRYWQSRMNDYGVSRDN